MKTETVPTELKQVTEIIKQKANPVRIVLFGSRARGNHTASSEYKNWLKRAKSAFDLSRIDKGKNIVYEDLCFQAQQAAEKARQQARSYTLAIVAPFN